MFPMMWSQPPCMNIEVRIVAHQGGPSRSTTRTPGFVLGLAPVRAAVADDRLDAGRLGSLRARSRCRSSVPGWISR